MFVPDRGADRLYGYYVAGPYSVSQVLNVTLLLVWDLAILRSVRSTAPGHLCT
jgi:hypothetical protein